MEENIKVCPNCGSSNTTIQIVNDVIIKTKHHSIFWWILIGWWFVSLMWMIFTIPKIFIKLFGLGHKNIKSKNITKKKVVCQDCGNFWDIK